MTELAGAAPDRHRRVGRLPAQAPATGGPGAHRLRGGGRLRLGQPGPAPHRRPHHGVIGAGAPTGTGSTPPGAALPGGAQWDAEPERIRQEAQPRTSRSPPPQEALQDGAGPQAGRRPDRHAPRARRSPGRAGRRPPPARPPGAVLHQRGPQAPGTGADDCRPRRSRTWPPGRAALRRGRAPARAPGGEGDPARRAAGGQRWGRRGDRRRETSVPGGMTIPGGPRPGRADPDHGHPRPGRADHPGRGAPSWPGVVDPGGHHGGRGPAIGAADQAPAARGGRGAGAHRAPYREQGWTPTRPARAPRRLGWPWDPRGPGGPPPAPPLPARG